MSASDQDARIDELAGQAQKILDAPSKSDAIRQALERVVESVAPPDIAPGAARAARLKAIQDEVKRLGTPNPGFDDKAFLDEMWGHD